MTAKFRQFLVLIIVAITLPASAQNRIQYGGQSLFLSGLNLAWKNFAADIGPGNTDLAHFDNVYSQMETRGGNCMRLWLHTNGANTPAWSGNNVTGPGNGTIADLKNILDKAYERRIGMILCLWSFDMLRTSYGSAITNRSRALLTNPANRLSYINNSLIPMVQALAGHPAIIGWEIFNEPEGMSNEFGWSFTQHVPMSDIQAFVNLCAGAIHRADPLAKVTNGAWSFYSTTDVGAGNFNYYRDDRLIAAGGDPDGTLDFYTVHYYDWAGTQRSPFNRPASYWGLTKPLVVAEFYPGPPDCINCGSNPYQTLYNLGYAGALAWSWTDSTPSTMLGLIQGMTTNHPADVVIVRNSLPLVAITAPAVGAAVPQGSSITLTANATDTDGTVTTVEFYSGTVKLGEDTSAPWSYIWASPPAGSHSLTARATDNQGAKSTSSAVPINVFLTASAIRLQAEDATYSGVTLLNDATADQGKALKMDNTGTITWTVPGIPAAGNYVLRFGYLIPFGSKTQDLSINNGAVSPLLFDGATGSWILKSWTVPLLAGTNSIRIQKNWGYMNFDYIEIILPGPPAAPQIAILGGVLEIQNGDTSSVPEDGTSFGSLAITAPAVVRTFTIENLGTAPLNLTGASLGGADSGAFAISNFPTQIPATGTAPFTISFDPALSQPYSATVTILSNDGTNSPFTFSISGEGTGTPVLAVQGASAGGDFTQIPRDSIASAILGTVFSGTFPRGSTNLQFKLLNTGSDSLILGTVQVDNPAFTIIAQPASIPVGGEAFLSITFSPPAQGTYDSNVQISGSSIAPYNFGIVGTGLERPSLSASFGFTDSASAVVFPSLVGWFYQVETSIDLMDWVPAPGIDPALGTGSLIQIPIPGPLSAPARFYRLSEY